MSLCQQLNDNRYHYHKSTFLNELFLNNKKNTTNRLLNIKPKTCNILNKITFNRKPDI